ncbi:MAG: histidine phosphotransferase family protein [Rickettsiales bacterium]
MIDDINIAELLCTRLCHDLTGPIGAVNNGAEFLSEEGFDLKGQAVDLIVSSAFSAVSRLQFYRMAYGNIKNSGEANLAEKRKVAEDFFVGSEITLDWPDAHADASGVSVSFRMVRLIYNLIIILSSSLIRGGSVSVRMGKDELSRKNITVHAKGESMKFNEEVDEVLLGESFDGEITPKNVQLYLTRRYAKDLGVVLECKKDNGLIFKVVQ